LLKLGVFHFAGSIRVDYGLLVAAEFRRSIAVGCYDTQFGQEPAQAVAFLIRTHCCLL
jgi:hypothetical protein